MSKPFLHRSEFAKRLPFGRAAAVGAAVLLAACSSGSDPLTSLGRQSILDQVNQALNDGDCATAVMKIGPLYNSVNTDNDVRMIAASAYVCYAGMNFFAFLNDLTSNAGSLAGQPFWEFLTRTFPSTVGADHVVEGALLSSDALMAVLQPGIPILPADFFNYPGNNPASLNLNDRTNDANSYLAFVAMAAVGGLQSRYGAPYANGRKSQNLTWNTAAAVDANGCAYASAIVNLVDSLGPLSNSSTAMRTNLLAIQAALEVPIFHACDIGCQNSAPAWGGPQSGCTVTTACASCPTGLRDRSACTGVVSDQVSCAAAGIVNYMNLGAFGWKTGP
jgi:hypothetical protein